MAQNDLLRRYLDAGMAFTAITRSRAEAIVKDLVKAGELQAEQTQKAVDDVVERSRKNTERLLETVRKEVRSQIANLGLATQADIARLEKKIAALSKSPAKKAPAKKAVKAVATADS
jgi:polyhydroxyalkanoate synthesis regulator phasin